MEPQDRKMNHDSLQMHFLWLYSRLPYGLLLYQRNTKSFNYRARLSFLLVLIELTLKEQQPDF